MIVRQLKLKLSKTQKEELEKWLWNLTGVYNWAIRKIGMDARDKVYHTPFGFKGLLVGHSRKIGIPSSVLRGTLVQAYGSWQRCFKKLAKPPKLKGRRNKLNSIPFPDPIKPPKDRRITLWGIGKVRFHKQCLPDADIKCGRLVKRASGWYLCLWLDTDHKFPVQETDNAVGIDPGFHSLLTLSDGTKFENPRELRKGAERLAQAQRGNNLKLAARLQERQANRRSDRNHKISRKVIETYKTIFYSDDNFGSVAKKFGKSVSEAGLGQLIGYITYKGRTGGRNVVPINSAFTTQTCSACGARTGPHGLGGLAVRSWECSACGAVHDRDINSAVVVLKTGAGVALKVACNG